VRQVKTPILALPSSAEIVAEPLGVVLVISAWNYPICELKVEVFLITNSI